MQLLLQIAFANEKWKTSCASLGVSFPCNTSRIFPCLLPVLHECITRIFVALKLMLAYIVALEGKGKESVFSFPIYFSEMLRNASFGQAWWLKLINELLSNWSR